MTRPCLDLVYRPQSGFGQVDVPQVDRPVTPPLRERDVTVLSPPWESTQDSGWSGISVGPDGVRGRYGFRNEGSRGSTRPPLKESGRVGFRRRTGNSKTGRVS